LRSRPRHTAFPDHSLNPARRLFSARRVDTWYADLFLEIGPEAYARRSRALPLLAREPERLPDSPMSGPEVASDDSVRARFFGED